MKNSFNIWILIFLIPLTIMGQTDDLDRQIQDQERTLKELRKSIDQLNSKISRSQKDKQATAAEIHRLDKQITMISQLKRELQKESRLKEQQIDLLIETIKSTDEKITALKKRAARRAVYAYKLGRNRDIDLLLTSGDINQALRRSTYLSAITKAEKQTLAELEAMIQSNRSNQNNLARTVGSLKRNIEERERASRDIAAKQGKKKRQLKNIDQNITALKADLETKQRGKQKLQETISELINQRASKYKSTSNFAKNKGSLRWPVRGQLVGRFGPHKNEKLGTVTHNPGIDIAAAKGKDVHAVQDGYVVAITWIPGYGNTLIIDHGDNFYTVYAHIDNIKVAMDNKIFLDQVIAQVSDTGSLHGSRLHFEVWQGENKVDPIIWLRR
ncbi:MAG: peptidoglycan DD-metalloendopeptidase family protein [Candidatus Marinimicrobia bacterium]|nr:peptidoglycan DD-metalloendopeptidase family protein [Candidatus Neomarinimicrobiota bacterium]MCF7904018.1 peptidoglycan DD-metalloendopeptidase family protein [Candidatus Neomarinimicrobiota bacterium]